MGLFDAFRTAVSAERGEQSFDHETGRYRRTNGQFDHGSPPTDYDQSTRRFRAEDGQFKGRSKDLGMGTQHDAPARDSATDMGRGEREDDLLSLFR